MTDTQKLQLLSDVKLHLGITWSDSGTDSNVENAISSGKAYLDDKFGTPADYLSAGEPRTLLFEYVRYFINGALDVFEANYLHRLNAMQNKRKVMQYAQNPVSSEE